MVNSPNFRQTAVLVYGVETARGVWVPLLLGRLSPLEISLPSRGLGARQRMGNAENKGAERPCAGVPPRASTLTPLTTNA